MRLVEVELEQLEREKAEAVRVEEYGTAHQIKQKIDGMK